APVIFRGDWFLSFVENTKTCRRARPFPPVSNVLKIENSFFYTRCNLLAWCRYRGSQNYREITSDCCGRFANLVFHGRANCTLFPFGCFVLDWRSLELYTTFDLDGLVQMLLNFLVICILRITSVKVEEQLQSIRLVWCACLGCMRLQNFVFVVKAFFYFVAGD
ncbi:hypothetical protein IscW_ISCW016135, partial [Ixodes scapularis]